MSAMLVPDGPASPREPVRTQRRRWRLGSAMRTGRGGRRQPTTDVQGPPGSPAWWLANAHGFLVDDQADHPIGVVDDVLLDHAGKHPRALVVVQGWGRRWLVVPVHAVTKIAPAERRLTVARPPDPEGWPQIDTFKPPWPLRRLRDALGVARRLVPGRR